MTPEMRSRIGAVMLGLATVPVIACVDRNSGPAAPGPLPFNAPAVTWIVPNVVMTMRAPRSPSEAAGFSRG